jgi:hypothetical protein
LQGLLKVSSHAGSSGSTTGIMSYLEFFTELFKKKQSRNEIKLFLRGLRNMEEIPVCKKMYSTSKDAVCKT